MRTEEEGQSTVRLVPSSGTPANALKFSINLTTSVGSELKRIAFDNRLSESSIVEVALIQLFARVSPEVLGTFLRRNGACLRRKA
jgi:hypothetical protein